MNHIKTKSTQKNISVFVQQKLSGDVIKGIRVLGVFLTHFQPMFYFWKHRKTGGFQGVKKWNSGWKCVDTTDAQNDLNTIEQLSLQLVYYQKYYSHKQNDLFFFPDVFSTIYNVSWTF